MNSPEQERLKARQNAIETLIDMHPNGADYRAARTMSETLKSNLESRHNRIPDWALLDHAKSLSKYEILPDSDEVYGDLLRSNTAIIDEEETTATAGTDDDEKTQHQLKEGWEERVLRHHEKIVRAKNSTNAKSGGGVAPNNKTAAPPPRLISVLRQIFDTPSSGDLKELLVSTRSSVSDGDSGGKSDNGPRHQVNVLPSLLHSVVNHPVFSSDSPTSREEEFSSTVKRHLDGMFDTPKKEEGEGEATEDKDAKEADSAPQVLEVEPPSAANLEAIVGNVCRDIRKYDSIGKDNTNIHGLLIASLSILTGSFLQEDNLDDFFAAEEGQPAPITAVQGTALKSPDSSWNATPDSYLQVGGLLSLLDTKKGDDRFLVDKSLSRYFAEASSVYEERIEIQKSLLQTGSPSSDAFTTPKEFKSMLSADSAPIPPLSSRVGAENDEPEVIDIVPDDDDGLPSSDRLDSDELTNVDVADLSRMLLSGIANLVGDELNFDGEEEVDADEDEEGDDNIEEEEEDDEEEDADDVEEAEDRSDEDASQVTRDYQEISDNADVEEAQSDGVQEQAQDGASNEEDGDETNNDTDERMMFQRALALSLGATVSTGNSDSNSDSNDEDRKISAVKSPSERRDLKTEELKRKSSGDSMQTSDGADPENANLPSLPKMPSMEVLPRNLWNDELSESYVKSVLDPSVLSAFGNVPASHVLVQLLQTILHTMEGCIVKTKAQKEQTAMPKSPTKTLISSMRKSRGQLKDDTQHKDDDSVHRRDFMPDALTAQLLVASLHLSSYLRSYSIGALNEILSDKEEETVKCTREEGDSKEEAIQVDNSAENEDPINEDPVLVVVASETSLENKGFERKSAAAANITALRHSTKQKMISIWVERASFYSRCCHLNMRCLRILIARCIEQRIRFSDVPESDARGTIYLSTKARIGLAKILSGFYSVSVSATFRELQHSISAFFDANQPETNLSNELLNSSLRSESLLLWGSCLPFLCPTHTARVQMLRNLVQDGLKLEPSCYETANMMMYSNDWNEGHLYSVKLDILCQRLSMSDMLDCCVASPKVHADGDKELLLPEVPSSGSVIASVLCNFLSSTRLSSPNVHRLYYAVCSRLISSLLWNDLALTPSESIGEDGSLKIESSPKFHFDPSKCADSIAIERSTANQRATKVWGCALSTTCFLPKTGVHRFAVKLDKCERGHIFIGVGTARVNTKTYVGGDKNGWGFIGTQALWHDRNKIRGDYGSILRTGAVVVVTLDTDLGTLSYGLMKDVQCSESNAAVGPMSPSLALSSPRKSLGLSNGGGTMVEDWGVAFEGLPLDSKLFPAVGLYQRDDCATLLTVSSSNASPGKTTVPATVSSGQVYYPSVDEEGSIVASQIRSWNEALCSSSISFATDVLMTSIKLLSSATEVKRNVISEILPPLASALCLIPSCIPNLSAKYAMELLPFVTRCAKLIDNLVLPENIRSSLNVGMKEGKWLIQIGPLSDVDFKDNDREYTINITPKPVSHEDADVSFCGEGKSSKVSLTGVVRGTHLKVIEQRDNSKSLIDARLNLDGSMFEGTYSIVGSDALGSVSGYLQVAPSYATAAEQAACSDHKSNQPSTVLAAQEQRNLIRTESILCLAVNHLSLTLSSATVMCDIGTAGDLRSDINNILESCSILTAGRFNEGRCIRRFIDSVWERCKVSDSQDYHGGSDIVEQWQDLIYLDLLTASDVSIENNPTKTTEIKSKLDASAVQSGSFSRLCPEQYMESWENITAALLYHCQIDDDELSPEQAKQAFGVSRQIIESGIRVALSCVQSSSKSRSEICQHQCYLLNAISDFLFELLPNRELSSAHVTDQFLLIYSAIRSQEDLNSLKRIMDTRTENGIMSYVGMRAIEFLLASDGIRLLPAAESVIIVFHKLANASRSPSSSSSIFMGCSSCLQKCASSTVNAVHDRFETLLGYATSCDELVSLSSTFLSLYTFVGCRPTAVKKFGEIATYCRELAFREIGGSSTEQTLINSMRIQSVQQVLQANTAALQGCLTKKADRDAVSVVQLVLHEIKHTAAIVSERWDEENDRKEFEGICLDWEVYTRKGPSCISSADNLSIATALANISPLMAAKNAISSSHGYLGQLLDLLHWFVSNQSMHQSLHVLSTEIILSLLATLKMSLPDCIKLRSLRLLRPVLSATDASSDAVEQLLELAGGFSTQLENNETTLKSDDDAVHVSESAVATLRYLYASSPEWRKTIHEVIITSYSYTSVCGVVSFLGGMPGCLQLGSFLMIEPDIASSLSSTSSLLASKTRSALGGNTSTMNNSAGRGVEGIVSGLCRQTAHAGLLCNSDSKGMCDVMLMPSRQMQPDESIREDPKVTIRAVRVSSSQIAHAAELPIRISADMITTNIIGLLLEHLNLSASSLTNKSSKGSGDTSLETLPSLKSLFSSAMSIRSMIIILSNPDVVESTNHLHDFLASVLHLAYTHSITTTYGLSKLPAFEARLWHLVKVLSVVRSRMVKIKNTPTAELAKMMQNESQVKKDNPPINAPEPEISGFRTPLSSSLASSIFGLPTQRAASRTSSASTAGREDIGGGSRDEDEESQNAASLREAAIVQMAELGLPRQWAELALRRTGDIEAAVHFCLERGTDMERLIAEEANRSSSSRRRPANTRMNSSHLISQLVDMGFPRHWCVQALSATSNNVDEALTWILTNGDRLAAAQAEDEEKDEESDEEEANNWEEEEEAELDEVSTAGEQSAENVSSNEVVENLSTPSSGWHGSICPIRFVSGKSRINPETLEICGLKDGGFSSVGTKGVLLTSGKWYYEAEILTAGCLQIGWADSSFAGHCQAERGDGCGDGPSSWAFDGWRRYRWHSDATEWGCRWSEGDIVGCLVDMDAMTISFTLNGRGEEIGMGLAFSGEGFRPCSGVYCCVSFNSREKLRLILGGEGTESFKHKPYGYRGVGEAILNAVKERQILLSEELAVSSPHEPKTNEKPSYICDFSDGEHGHELFSWQHRFCGSDASVHLGNRTIRGTTSKKTLKSSTPDSSKNINHVCADIEYRLTKLMESAKQSTDSDDNDSKDPESAISSLKRVYSQILTDVENELRTVCASLNYLYAQKLVLHLLVAYSDKFSTRLFQSDPAGEDEICRQLFRVFERTTSISTWLGEAGAMAVCAEALGLGISTYDATFDCPPGMCTTSSGQEILAGGISQVLSTAVLIKNSEVSHEGVYTPWTFAAASEAAIGSDSGGALSFIRHGLQNALAESAIFRKIMLAGVRKSVRILAVTEFSKEDGLEEDESTDVIPPSKGGSDTEDSPDARLVCFMTGILLSEPLMKQLSETEKKELLCSLFEGWSVGLLAASAPWRMICATAAAGILNLCPAALAHVTSRIPVIGNYLGRLESTAARRVWAERAAVPVCSKYSQALIELLTSVKRAQRLLCSDDLNTFLAKNIRVDAATPLPFTPNFDANSPSKCSSCWEWDNGWISSDGGWEVLTGTVQIMVPTDWKPPQRSIVRTLMDSGEGPPFLDIGSQVVRGQDWGSRSDSGNEDGQDLYEKDKIAKEMELAEQEAISAKQDPDRDNPADDPATDPADDPAIDDPLNDVDVEARANSPEVDPPNPADDSENDKITPDAKQTDEKTKRKKAPKSKLPIGTVIGIEPWNGINAMARRVRWHLTGEEGVYRFGGDGGRFDIAHVVVNEKETRIKKRHPLPESMEQIASRYGFGQMRTCNIILRLDRASTSHFELPEIECNGILEWPDFGAGIQVECILFRDGAISITEKKLLYGSKDSGWEARFGAPSYISGTCTVISPIHNEDSLTPHEVLLGSSSFLVTSLRNREQNGDRLRVTSEMRLFRTRKGTHDSTQEQSRPEYAYLLNSPSQMPPICFDSDFHASSISLSKDKRTVTCSSSEGRGVAFANVGFSTGVHYWEVKIEKAEIGSVFIGVAEKPGVPSGSSQGSSFGFESKPRLNRWLGWGFVNFRATYSAGAERVYGSHCHSGDTVGVMLDCDSGRISYFYDGLKYGEHILNDLGCAFENVSPFGFNADGCGSGGAGQGAPSGSDVARSGRFPSNGAVRPRALWPVIGLRHPGDRVTMSSKWMTSKGVDGVTVQENVMSFDEIVCAYKDYLPKQALLNSLTETHFPQWFVQESFLEYKRWQSGRWLRTSTRGSGPYKLSSNGLDIDLDTTPIVCATACAAIGLPIALLPGDKIDVKRSAGRLLELQEEAVVLGAYQGRLWYRLVSQKSEGGSLMEGGGRAWFWDESEAVEGGLNVIGEGKGRSIALPKINRFRPIIEGLKIVYTGGAVVRSDLEIFDGSANLGIIEHGTVIPVESVIERRVNSCGVVRFLIDYEPIGRGWISSRIRGGKEEPIVEILPCDKTEDCDTMCSTPEDSAKVWYESYLKSIEADPNSMLDFKKKDFVDTLNIDTIEEYGNLLEAGCVNGMSPLESDSFIASTYGKICDVLPHTDEIDCPFVDFAIILAGASSGNQSNEVKELIGSVDSIVQEIALESLMHVKHEELPPIKALLARISMLRAINRRARYALPWFSLCPAQECSAVFGGLSGYGSSLERTGRTWDTKSNSMWVQIPSTSIRLRECKNILFPSIKRSLLDSIMDTTATPTPLSHDEYELPREVRTVRVNRLKARQAIAHGDSTLIRKHSVFSQLQREMKGWSGATLRRGFVAKGHGGQKRAFKVKLVGEGVNDYSGPYREVFTDAMQEVVNIDKDGQSSLGLLKPTPNNESELGDGRDLFMFSWCSGSVDTFIMNGSMDQLSSKEKEMLNSFSTLTRVSTEQSREVEEAITFLGKLAATACRHSIPVDLPLPFGVVWDRLAEEPFHPIKNLHEIDLLACNRMKEDDYHDVAASNANNTLSTQRRLLNCFAEGMSSVMPVELLSLFTGEQLRDILCGNPDIDVELLRRVVEYEGYNENDAVISYLWDVLREMSTSERKLFLQFVWARNRLPLKEADFDAPFRIQKDTKLVRDGDDYPMPSASTCFFSLMLPEYPNKEVLKEKLLFAIENVTTMESDYVTNDVEVREGWRDL